jgi:hypothetical protein
VGLVLASCPKLSNRKVAEACGVDDTTVAGVKRSLEDSSAEIPHPEGEAGEPALEAPDPDSAIVARPTRTASKLVAQCPRLSAWSFSFGELFEGKTTRTRLGAAASTPHARLG